MIKKLEMLLESKLYVLSKPRLIRHLKHFRLIARRFKLIEEPQSNVQSRSASITTLEDTDTKKISL